MYSKLLTSYPLLTKSISCGLICSLGDFLTQKFIEEKQDFNGKRNFAFFLAGTYYLGPLLHLRYSKFLPYLTNKILDPSAHKYKRALVGTAFDQLIFTPISLSGFFIALGFNSTFTIEGAEKGIQNMKLKFMETLLTNWKIWPIATMAILIFVPAQFQVLSSNFIGLFWNMYLSYISYR